MRISHAVQKIQGAISLAKFKDEQAKKEHFEAYTKAKTKEQKIKLFQEAIAEGWVVPRQLSLFSPSELADCYLHSVVIKRVRQALHKEKQKKQKLGQVIKFPVKFVS